MSIIDIVLQVETVSGNIFSKLFLKTKSKSWKKNFEILNFIKL